MTIHASLCHLSRPVSSSLSSLLFASSSSRSLPSYTSPFVSVLFSHPSFAEFKGTLAGFQRFNLLSLLCHRCLCGVIRAGLPDQNRKGSKRRNFDKGQPRQTKRFSSISEPLDKKLIKFEASKSVKDDNFSKSSPSRNCILGKTPTRIQREKDEWEQKGAIMGKGDKQPKAGPKELSLRNSNARAARSISYLQIIGTGMDTEDTAPSVLLFFDNKRFVFNAGEGLQRFCVEHKIKLTKIDHIFFTRVCSETTGGLPGALLTLAGEHGISVNIWGPSDLCFLVDAMRSFLPQASMFHVHSFGQKNEPSSATKEGDEDDIGGVSHFMPGVILEEEVVKISAVLLYPMPSEVQSCGEVSTVLNSHQCTLLHADKNQEKVKETHNPTTEGSLSDGTLTSSEQPSHYQELRDDKTKTLMVPQFCKPGDISVVYICELPEVKGKFDPSKAALLGLERGPKYGRLQVGESVVSDDGKRMVYPSDVMGPSSPGPIIILVDCPTLSHIPSLLSATYFQNFYRTSEMKKVQKLVTCMVHIGPKLVIQDAQYQQWMDNFVGTQHIIAGHGSHNMTSPVLKSSTKLLVRLNFLCPQIFPISHCPLLYPESVEQESAKKVIQAGDSSCASIITAKNLLKFRLLPLAVVGLDDTTISEEFSIKEIQDSLTESPEVVAASKEIRELWDPPHQGSDACGQTVEATELAATNPGAMHFSVDAIVAEPGRKGTDSAPGGADTIDIISVSSSSSNESSDYVPENLQNIDRSKLEITFLGTGSSQPSKYRNVSAIYLHLFDRGGLLLDCGEGTYAQLKRRFGITGADTVVENLKCVWVSHIHADHHSGLARILSMRAKILREKQKFSPIVVVGPRQLKSFLEAYSRLEELGMHFLDCTQTTDNANVIAKESGQDLDLEHSNSGDFLDMEDVESGSIESCSAVTTKRKRPDSETLNLDPKTGGFIRFKTLGQQQASELDVRSTQGSGQLRNYWLQPGFHLQKGLDTVGREKLKNALSELGLSSLTSVPVIHCPQSFGVVIEAQMWNDHDGVLRPGWKLAYSGDTRPCQALRDAAKGATVLIHEATFDDGLLEEAIFKNHSLTSEAIEVGIAAGAYRTILTHFSQRYPKLPVFDNSYNNRTCVAFDMMSVNAADLWLLPKLVPALKLLFKDEVYAEEEPEDYA